MVEKTAQGDERVIVHFSVAKSVDIQVELVLPIKEGSFREISFHVEVASNPFQKRGQMMQPFQAVIKTDNLEHKKPPS